jgi:hypothetical protein
MLVGVCHGMVELIRRVIPAEIVGGDVNKLKKMDALVHICYEISGTFAAFFSAFLILTLGNGLAPILSPFLFFGAAGLWRCIALTSKSEKKPKLCQLWTAFSSFFHSVKNGAQLIFGHSQFRWLLTGYALPLFLHRYLESQLSPYFAKYVLREGAYAQVLVGGSNLGELIGAFLVFLWAEKILTPIPW